MPGGRDVQKRAEEILAAEREAAAASGRSVGAPDAAPSEAVPDGTAPPDDDAPSVDVLDDDAPVPPPAVPTLPPERTAELTVMELAQVTVELPSPFAVARLIEPQPPRRRLEIPIGLPDGTALATALRRIQTPRPLTHELFSDVLRRLSVDVVSLRIIGRTRGTYLAELDLGGLRGREIVPCRPSDGLALAIRQGVAAPILVDVRLLSGDGDADVLPA